MLASHQWSVIVYIMNSQRIEKETIVRYILFMMVFIFVYPAAELHAQDKDALRDTQKHDIDILLTPSSKICKDNGGMVVNHRCKASWVKANMICELSGGRLPSLKELKNIVNKCGGKVLNYSDQNWSILSHKNSTNKQYKSCIQSQNLLFDFYWSSTEDNKKSGTVWNMSFFCATQNRTNKLKNAYVHCVRR